MGLEKNFNSFKQAKACDGLICHGPGDKSRAHLKSFKCARDLHLKLQPVQ